LSGALSETPENLESPVLMCVSFPPGWYYSVVCSYYGQIRHDKYWQGPSGEGYRSFKALEAGNPGIEYDRDLFMADVAVSVKITGEVMMGERGIECFTDRTVFEHLPADDDKDKPEVVMKQVSASHRAAPRIPRQ